MENSVSSGLTPQPFMLRRMFILIASSVLQFCVWDRLCTPLTFFRTPFLFTSLPRRTSLGPIGTPAGRENDYHYQTDGRTTGLWSGQTGAGGEGRAGRMTLSLPVVVCRPSLLPRSLAIVLPSPFRRPSAVRWSLLQRRCIFPFFSEWVRGGKGGRRKER